jgi:hypothetical protein
VECAGTGSIYSFTVIHRAPIPDFHDDVPNPVALVDLDEGVRWLSRLFAEPDTVAIGVRVAVACDEVTEGASLPAFRLV